MDERRCRRCNRTLSTDQFYKSRKRICKRCYSKKCREWYKNNSKRAILINKQWVRKHPEKVKQYRLKHRAKQAVYYRKWYAEHGRQRRADYIDMCRSWDRAHPEAERARQLLRNAIKSGKLQRPSVCSECGRTNTRLHAHHSDYTQPLKVVWLCASCHKNLHNGLKQVLLSE